MSIIHRFNILLKAISQLGFSSLSLYARYQIGLRSGYYRWATSTPKTSEQEGSTNWEINSNLIALPSRESLLSNWGANFTQLLSLADEIVAGQVHLFGGPAVPLDLIPHEPLGHWTDYERMQAKSMPTDIKWAWEPARFGWAITLAQAYLVSNDERYSQAFWHSTELFLKSNPAYKGPNWISAQEVALRLIALVFSIQVFYRSPHTTPEKLSRLGQAIAEHARRIPPTLVYARAQNNNHLLCEAAGLITAGLALPEHPHATRWLLLGRRWFFHAIQSQIALDGAYIQHSTNYHRLLLQIALWVHTLGEPFPDRILDKLAAATQWLLKLVDPESGGVPNLGPNDGANIIPLSTCPFSDYRPTLQAASLIFQDSPAFSPGPWDDMSLWLNRIQFTFPSNPNVSPSEIKIALPLSLTHRNLSPHIIPCPDHSSWAYLRAAQFSSRPGHADQLHLDLWWRGMNIAMDPGTFSYNDPAPWNNALASSRVHNTVSINNLDQMTRAGRFLWLDWAQAEIVSSNLENNSSSNHIIARHNGYRRIGVLHQRTVIAEQGGRWRVLDDLEPIDPSDRQKNVSLARQFSIRLHWLLPDWPWVLESEAGNTNQSIQLESPYGLVKLNLDIDPENILSQPEMQVVRAGETLFGNEIADPTWGWISPTYQSRFPALSIGYRVEARLPVVFNTEWILPNGEKFTQID